MSTGKSVVTIQINLDAEQVRALEGCVEVDVSAAFNTMGVS